MKHLKKFNESNFTESDDTFNEGVKEFLFGGLLILSSLFPSQSISKNTYNYDGVRISVSETKNSITKKELIKALKKIEKEGFKVEPGKIPVSILLKNLKDGEFTILNTSSQTMGSANGMITQIVKNNGGKEIIRLFKKTGTSIQAIVVVRYK